MSPRIAPVTPPYPPELEGQLRKWMPPGVTLEPLALFRTLARHPLLFERMRPLGAALLGKGLLPARVRELLILRTCARCGAEYEWGVHVAAFAVSVGLDGAVVAQTEQASVEQLARRSDDDALVLRFADELHDSARLSDATHDLLAARFTPEQLLEMMVLVGQYHLISFVVNAARVELEPWASRFAEGSTGHAP